ATASSTPATRPLRPVATIRMRQEASRRRRAIHTPTTIPANTGTASSTPAQAGAGPVGNPASTGIAGSGPSDTWNTLTVVSTPNPNPGPARYAAAHTIRFGAYASPTTVIPAPPPTPARYPR